MNRRQWTLRTLPTMQLVDHNTKLIALLPAAEICRAIDTDIVVGYQRVIEIPLLEPLETDSAAPAKTG